MPPKKSSKQPANVNPAIAKRNQEIDDTIRADLLKLDKEGLIQYLWNFRREWCWGHKLCSIIFKLNWWNCCRCRHGLSCNIA